MRKSTIILSYVILTFMLFSCNLKTSVDGIQTEFKKAGKTMTISKDPSFAFCPRECLYCVDITIVGDSLILLRENDVNEKTIKFYKAYRLSDFSYIGDLLMKGRGPGEFFCPGIEDASIADSVGKPMGYVFDIALSKAFILDVNAALQSNSSATLTRLPDLPQDVVYAYPYLDSLQFVMNIVQDRLWCHIVDSLGNMKNSRCLFESVSATRNLPLLGSTAVFNRNDGRIAVLMACLPQVIIMDAGMGEVGGIAVDKAYKDWKKIMNMTGYKTGAEPVRYYRDAVSGDGFIIGLYKGYRDRGKEHPGTHIHIFDWNGDFLYDLTVKENIGAVTYDKTTGYLYGLDKTNGEIYRYNLSSID